MSFEEYRLEDRPAEAIARPEAAKSQVLVIARTQALGKDLMDSLALDDTVAASVLSGTLSSVMMGGTVDWPAIRFVVFEGDAHSGNDIAALTGLTSMPGVKLSCIAMLHGPLTPDLAEPLLEAGVVEVLPMPAHLSPGASEAVAQAPKQVSENGGDVTVVLRARGGAGATTVAVNLATTHAQKIGGGKTALVDLDIQNGAVALALDLPDSPAASTLIRGQVQADAGFVEAAMEEHSSGLHVLTAPDVFAPLSALQPELVDDLLTALRARYDHIVIDMPQGVADWIEPVLRHAARVLVVTDTSLPAIRRTRRLIDLISEEHMTLPLQVVVNGEKRPMMMTAAQKETARLIGRPMEHWIPADAKAARVAVDMGVPMILGAKRSAAARGLKGLAEAVFAAKKKSEAL
ncbi:AAA family ATPase [Alphaproteobacteria bacterium KMM 3653]|uniref:AAA family ATPase n=1 Tax=Harenicola maris TaxID=2841044 RepID=A0AAP2CNH3_9RHOB|nr:AAA family ATPase [Harenicola maris]